MLHRTKFVGDESATTAVEYAVMLGLIIAVALVAVTQLGSGNGASVQDSADKINSALSGS